MYILNLRSKTIHKHPTLEQCNMDACKRKKKVKNDKELDRATYKDGHYFFLCDHCFK